MNGGGRNHLPVVIRAYSSDLPASERQTVLEIFRCTPQRPQHPKLNRANLRQRLVFSNLISRGTEHQPRLSR
jgi:hypothetical protein